MVIAKELESSIPQNRERFKNAHHLALMWTPNLLNPQKLLNNLRNPIGEVFHTKHTQYPIDMREGIEYHVVEHRVFKKLVTVDIIHQDSFSKGILPRLKQLFDKDFYYGHDKFFPQPFKLIDRTFVKDGFDLENHVQQILKQK